MDNVLVTGATGFIGIEVSRQLAERGKRPRLMVRRPVRGLMLRNLDAEIMQADIRSPKSLRRILKGIDTVIHLGARAAFEPYPRLYPSIVIGSTNLMQAAIEARVSNFVFGGSLLVYGDTDNPWIKTPSRHQCLVTGRPSYGRNNVLRRWLERMMSALFPYVFRMFTGLTACFSTKFGTAGSSSRGVVKTRSRISMCSMPPAL